LTDGNFRADFVGLTAMRAAALPGESPWEFWRTITQSRSLAVIPREGHSMPGKSGAVR